MSRKNHSVLSAEVFIQEIPVFSENEHILEHVHFLEERANDLEERITLLEEVFRDMLENDEDDDDEEEDGWGDGDEEDEDEENDELEESNLYGHACCCAWSRVTA